VSVGSEFSENQHCDPAEDTGVFAVGFSVRKVRRPRMSLSSLALTCGNGFTVCRCMPTCSVLVDVPIAVRKSSGGEPLAVVVGQGVVALVSTFEPGDGDQWNAEMGGDGG
jgi:hypothetical protein